MGMCDATCLYGLPIMYDMINDITNALHAWETLLPLSIKSICNILQVDKCWDINVVFQ